MDIRSTFAKNLRACRKAARLSQEKLAERAGLHRTYIGGIEQQRVNVSLKNVGKIADALGVDPAILFLDRESEDVLELAAAAQFAGRRPYGAVQAQKDLPASVDALGNAPEGKTPLLSAKDVVATFARERKADEQLPQYALVSWNNGRMTMKPIEVAYEDLTVQILSDLISKGLRGSDLAARYADVHYEIISFLEGGDDEEGQLQHI